MKKIEKIINQVNEYLIDKDILEVACGRAEFSVCASKAANTVYCIDLDKHRLLPSVYDCSNIRFIQMDATEMSFENCVFDTVVIYNAVGHLTRCLEQVINESLRITKPNGKIIIIGTWKIDRYEMSNILIPLLIKKNIEYTAKETELFDYIIIST